MEKWKPVNIVYTIGQVQGCLLSLVLSMDYMQYSSLFDAAEIQSQDF